MSSRQMSSAVLITLDGDAPAPVSARLMPIRIGLPLWASAPEKKPSPIISEAPRLRSALRQRFMIVSSPLMHPGTGLPAVRDQSRPCFMAPKNASFPKAGGLILYGHILVTQFQQGAGAGYVDRKRRQACRPAVQYPTKLQLVINLIRQSTEPDQVTQFQQGAGYVDR